jgi:hypothetical protein
VRRCSERLTLPVRRGGFWEIVAEVLRRIGLRTDLLESEVADTALMRDEARYVWFSNDW